MELLSVFSTNCHTYLLANFRLYVVDNNLEREGISVAAGEPRFRPTSHLSDPGSFCGALPCMGSSALCELWSQRCREQLEGPVTAAGEDQETKAGRAHGHASQMPG